MMITIGVSLFTLLLMIALTFIDLSPYIEFPITGLLLLTNIGILVLCSFQVPEPVKQFLNKRINIRRI